MEGSKVEAGKATELFRVIEVNEKQIRSHLHEIVRGTVEETLNAMLEADAERLCGAGRYERSQERASTRAGSWQSGVDKIIKEIRNGSRRDAAAKQ